MPAAIEPPPTQVIMAVWSRLPFIARASLRTNTILKRPGSGVDLVDITIVENRRLGDIFQ